MGKVYVRRILRCAVLAPDLVKSILAGKQPAGLTLRDVTATQPPLLWSEQRQQFGLVT